MINCLSLSSYIRVTLSVWKLFRLTDQLFASSLYVFCLVFHTECWRGTDDIHGFFGIPHNLTTLAECQAACINSNTCVAIDWEPSNAGKTCWILTLPYTGPTLHTGVITHYKLNRTCAGEFCFYYTHYAFRLYHVVYLNQEFNISLSFAETTFLNYSLRLKSENKVWDFSLKLKFKNLVSAKGKVAHINEDRYVKPD